MANLDAYYFGFESTGVVLVDEILEAIANAGSGAHHTSDWGDMGYVDDIQNAANIVADTMRMHIFGI